MTTPTEQSIRKACEEAGLPPELFAMVYDTTPRDVVIASLIAALARRIEAEAVPVAWMYYADDGQEATPPLKNRLTPNTMGWTERALYTAPPKEPTT
jgi:hypothetical protein